ncbi:MAG: hypothetical protein ABR949_14595 [Candidatus Aquilonibacter sp.]|jgi:hypothetical protein
MLLIAILAAIGGAPAPMMPMQISSPIVMSAPPISRPVNPSPVREPMLKAPTANAAAQQLPSGRLKQMPLVIPAPLTQCNVDLHLLGAGDIFGIGLVLPPPPPPPALTC